MKQHRSELMAAFAPWLCRIGHRRGRLALGALLMVITVAAAIGLLALSGWFITATAIGGALLAAGGTAGVDIYRPGGGIRFFAITRTAARYFERLYNHDTVLRLLADLRASLFAALTRLDGQALSRLRAAEWLNRLTADIDALDSLYLRLLAPPLVALLAISGLGVLLGLVAPVAGIAVAGMLLALWAWLIVGQAWLGLTASRRRVATLDRLRALTIEQLQGLAELRCYGALTRHRRRIEDQERALYADQRRLIRRQALGNALTGLGVSLAAILALWLGVQAYGAAQLSGPLMVMLPLATLATGEALGLLPAPFTQLGATWASAQRLNALTAARGRIIAPTSPARLAPGAPQLAFDEVALVHDDAHGARLKPALKKLTLRLAAGEHVALIGASGAGKSSVAQLVLRLIDPTRGRVLLNDQDVRHLSLIALRERVSYLTQQTELFDATLADNLRLAAAEASDERLWQVLAMVELADWARELPRGLETWVGESGQCLSGGQARRVALARILLTEADMVVLDEPFAGLDEATARRIAARLERWLEGRTALLLAHDDRSLPAVDRIHRLREGELLD